VSNIFYVGIMGLAVLLAIFKTPFHAAPAPQECEAPLVRIIRLNIVHSLINLRADEHPAIMPGLLLMRFLFLILDTERNNMERLPEFVDFG